MDNTYSAQYSKNNIRSIASRLVKKYDVKEQHIYWIAKELNIYPDGVVNKKTKSVDMARTGKINRNNTEYVSEGKLNEKGIQAIESYLIQEGYKAKEEPIIVQSASIWEQADLISMMRVEYDKAVTERDEAKREAQENFELLKQYESEIDECEKENEELRDKLLIAEKENNALKEEKIQLGKMQLKTVDFDKEIDSLQKRIAQYNAEINEVSAEVNEFRKDVSVLMTGVSQLQEKKKKLDGVISDLIGCSKRLMNMK